MSYLHDDYSDYFDTGDGVTPLPRYHFGESLQFGNKFGSGGRVNPFGFQSHGIGTGYSGRPNGNGHGASEAYDFSIPYIDTVLYVDSYGGVEDLKPFKIVD